MKVPDSVVTVTCELYPTWTVMTWESWSVGDVTGSTHNGSGVGRGQKVAVAVGEGSMVSVGEGLFFTGLWVAEGGR